MCLFSGRQYWVRGVALLIMIVMAVPVCAQERSQGTSGAANFRWVGETLCAQACPGDVFFLPQGYLNDLTRGPGELESEFSQHDRIWIIIAQADTDLVKETQLVLSRAGLEPASRFEDNRVDIVEYRRPGSAVPACAP